MNAKRQYGFTLTEIVIVISIITILATILLSVFARVREANHVSICRDNLKQLVIAVQLYAQDTDGQLPDARWKAQIFPYIKVPGSFRCPTNTRLLPASIATEVSSVPAKERLATGYWYNAVDLSPFEHTGGSSIAARSRHEAALPNASTTWVMRDDQPSGSDGGGGGTLAYSQCNEQLRGGGATLHSGGSNVSFLDGHVKWMMPDTFYSTTCLAR